MRWGQNASDGTEGKKKLDEQFGKITGASSLLSYFYWSSTEHGDGSWAWAVGFDEYGNGYGHGYKYNNSFWLRAVLVF